MPIKLSAFRLINIFNNNTMRQTKIFTIIIVILLSNFCFFSKTKAFSVESLQNPRIDGDFVVGPGKHEIRINPGETSVKSITVTNRYDTERIFSIEIEDFTSPNKGDNSGQVHLLGEEKGPYSLKDYLIPDETSFVLQSGDRATIRVEIKIPEDATPGGLYGAVIISHKSTDPLEIARENEVNSGIAFRSRIASLFFVRINGDVFEEGELINFNSDKKIYKSGPIKFNFTYNNSGSVYVNPYGVLEIKNLYGTLVEKINVSPYYVMPGAERLTTKIFDREFTMGRYKATLKLNRGYGDIIDEKTVVFWVLPIKMVAGILIGLFLLLVIIRAIRNWFKKNFEYKGGKNKNQAPPQE